jgi:hypothetical protein
MISTSFNDASLGVTPRRYTTLAIISKPTPDFFTIDNVRAS